MPRLDLYRHLSVGHSVALVLLALLLYQGGCGRPDQLAPPWVITPQEEGGSEIFGIVLGQTTLVEIRRQLDKPAQVALFEEEGHYTLEAYFGRISAGGLTGRLIAVADLEQEALAALAARGINRKAQRSGGWKIELPEAAIREVQALPVQRLSYVADISYDEATLRRLFGEPSQHLPLTMGESLWLYPAKGILLLFSEQGPESFHYLLPDRFEASIKELRLPVRETE